MKPKNKLKNKLKNKIEKHPVGQRLMSDRHFRMVTIAFAGMGWNILYGIFNGVLGIIYGSVWFATMCAYYLILGMMRLSITMHIQATRHRFSQKRIMIFNGIALIILAVVLSGSVIINFKYPVAKKYNDIVMITIATFTFVMAFFAVRNIIRAAKEKNMQIITLRNISLAGVTASILSLQRSMITTFGEGKEHFRYVMEGANGMGVFLIVLTLGISMIITGKKLDQSPRDNVAPRHFSI